MGWLAAATCILLLGQAFVAQIACASDVSPLADLTFGEGEILTAGSYSNANIVFLNSSSIEGNSVEFTGSANVVLRGAVNLLDDVQISLKDQAKLTIDLRDVTVGEDEPLMGGLYFRDVPRRPSLTIENTDLEILLPETCDEEKVAQVGLLHLGSLTLLSGSQRVLVSGCGNVTVGSPKPYDPHPVNSLPNPTIPTRLVFAASNAAAFTIAGQDSFLNLPGVVFVNGGLPIYAPDASEERRQTVAIVNSVITISEPEPEVSGTPIHHLLRLDLSGNEAQFRFLYDGVYEFGELVFSFGHLSQLRGLGRPSQLLSAHRLVFNGRVSVSNVRIAAEDFTIYSVIFGDNVEISESVILFNSIFLEPDLATPLVIGANVTLVSIDAARIVCVRSFPTTTRHGTVHFAETTRLLMFGSTELSGLRELSFGPNAVLRLDGVGTLYVPALGQTNPVRMLVNNAGRDWVIELATSEVLLSMEQSAFADGIPVRANPASGLGRLRLYNTPLSLGAQPSAQGEPIHARLDLELRLSDPTLRDQTLPAWRFARFRSVWTNFHGLGGITVQAPYVNLTMGQVNSKLAVEADLTEVRDLRVEGLLQLTSPQLELFGVSEVLNSGQLELLPGTNASRLEVGEFPAYLYVRLGGYAKMRGAVHVHEEVVLTVKGALEFIPDGSGIVSLGAEVLLNVYGDLILGMGAENAPDARTEILGRLVFFDGSYVLFNARAVERFAPVVIHVIDCSASPYADGIGIDRTFVSVKFPEEYNSESPFAFWPAPDSVQADLAPIAGSVIPLMRLPENFNPSLIRQPKSINVCPQLPGIQFNPTYVPPMLGVRLVTAGRSAPFLDTSRALCQLREVNPQASNVVYLIPGPLFYLTETGGQRFGRTIYGAPLTLRLPLEDWNDLTTTVIGKLHAGMVQAVFNVTGVDQGSAWLKVLGLELAWGVATEHALHFSVDGASKGINNHERLALLLELLEKSQVVHNLLAEYHLYVRDTMVPEAPVVVEESREDDTGMIIGVVAAIAGVVLLIGGLMYWQSYQKKKRSAKRRSRRANRMNTSAGMV